MTDDVVKEDSLPVKEEERKRVATGDWSEGEVINALTEQIAILSARQAKTEKFLPLHVRELLGEDPYDRPDFVLSQSLRGKFQHETEFLEILFDAGGFEKVQELIRERMAMIKASETFGFKVLKEHKEMEKTLVRAGLSQNRVNLLLDALTTETAKKALTKQQPFRKGSPGKPGKDKKRVDAAGGARAKG
jgi:hypothetical protein